jgi:hypothetical protein
MSKRKREDSKDDDREEAPAKQLEQTAAAWPALVRNLGRVQNYGEPTRKKEMARAFREVLPYHAFPLVVIELLLEFMQRFLVCGVEVIVGGSVSARLWARDLCSPDEVWIAGTAPCDLFRYNNGEVPASAVDPKEGEVFLATSCGFVCKWKLDGPPTPHAAINTGRIVPTCGSEDWGVFFVQKAGLICTGSASVYEVKGDLSAFKRLDIMRDKETAIGIIECPEQKTHLLLSKARGCGNEGGARILRNFSGLEYKMLSPSNEFPLGSRSFGVGSAWTSKTGVLFEVSHIRTRGAVTHRLFEWKRIHFMIGRESSFPVEHEVLLTKREAVSFPADFPYACLSLPCDSPDVASSVLLIQSSRISWLKLKRAGSPKRGADPTAWTLWSQVLFFSEVDDCDDVEASVSCEGVVLIRLKMYRKRDKSTLPPFLLLIATLVKNADGEESLEIVSRIEDYLESEFSFYSNFSFLRHW